MGKVEFLGQRTRESENYIPRSPFTTFPPIYLPSHYNVCEFSQGVCVCGGGGGHM